MNEKMTYEIPTAEIVVLGTADVLSTSDNIATWSWGQDFEEDA